MTPQIPGYEIVEQLYTGSRTIVYRAIQTEPQQPVVIKVLRKEYPSFNELVQFCNQYTIAKDLSIPGILTPLGLQSLDNGYALVMEDWDGLALNQYLAEQTLTWVEVLSIALQLADMLHALAQHRIVHKDIKPANILIQPDSHQVKLIDFSIASQLPKEVQESQSPNSLEGTLAYLAPEQTGRMNRGIDYRTDFYALGVTLYQLLTDTLPFPATDPLELVHCHIAKIAAPVHQVNPQVPQALGSIVAKLMAKNAEDRYQSAMGLKHDLERCLHEWQATESIVPFILGERDLSDRFLIPEKLYGRETEVQTLLNAFDRVAEGASELMLVAGFSGIGKTAVVNEVHKPIVRQRGYFIKGKYDQFNRNIPLSAFVQALRDLMGQLLTESDEQLASWKSRILAAVENNGQFLIEVIPELAQVIGKQPAVAELSGSAAQNRFNLLFSKFIAVFTTREHPLVLFLDDLQWADAASLQLIKLLMQDNGYLLMLGAYRDNEVSPIHPFILTIDELKQTGTKINTITLAALEIADVNRLVADTLSCQSNRAKPLTELVMGKTQGNPFFLTQFLKALQEEGLISFNDEQRCWECDIIAVKDRSLTDDVVEFMAQQLQKLPAATQAALKLAACIGNEFDLNTLAIVSEQSPTEAAKALWQALREGLILPTSQIYKFFQDSNQASTESANPVYRFLHDRVQQAAYYLIPDQDKQQTHWQIGQLLLNKPNTLEIGSEIGIFEIANQLNLGRPSILQPNQAEELIHINLAAARKSKASYAFFTAYQYLKIGIEILPPNSWEEHYQSTLQLYEMAAEAAYLIGKFDQMDQLIQVALQYTKSNLEQIDLYTILLQAYLGQNQLAEAVHLALSIVEKLGVSFPKHVLPENIEQAFTETRSLVNSCGIESILRLPVMSQPEQVAAMQILGIVTPPVYFVTPNLYPLIVLKMVQLSITNGLSPVSQYAFACYGLLMAATEQFELSYQFGQLALELSNCSPKNSYQTKTLFKIHVFIQFWKEPLQKSLKPLADNYQLGNELGDPFFAVASAANYVREAFFAGSELQTLKDQILAYDSDIKPEYASIVNANHKWHQLILNFIGEAQDPCCLTGAAYDETHALAQYQMLSIPLAIYELHLNKLMLCYFFGNYEVAREQAQYAEAHVNSAAGMYVWSLFPFYDALIQIASIRQMDEIEQEASRQKATAHLQKLKQWAVAAPSNFLHKSQLVEAELLQVSGQITQAIDLYDCAIAGAKTNGYIQEEALANELAAKFYLDWGKERVAAGYMQEAYYCYARWGAAAKIQDLEQRYPKLLNPILQQQQISISSNETIMASGLSHPSPSHKSQTSTSQSSSISSTLDLITVLKASQALSSEIQLEQLLSTLLEMLLENSGADKALLLMPGQSDWYIEGMAGVNQAVRVETMPLSISIDLAHSLIHRVKQNHQLIVIVDAMADSDLISDEYMTHASPRSILCVPILHQGKLLAILYLENQVTIGAFTRDRIELLNVLCTQAAISIENARLYQEAKNYTQQLEAAQLQTVQSEKMASLGNLVAGVAHEINNPIGFLNGSVKNAKDYVKDLLEHLELYQQYYPNPVAAIQDNIEDIDLEFLREDLPKLLDSMNGATDRIKGISTSLRTFSRADTEHKVSANLHEGIDSTLLILKYRLKANEIRPAIEVVQDYGELTPFDCFPGQLNQVFMNILANAIDMFDEVAQTQSLEKLQAHPQILTIQTMQTDNQVVIGIRDNGKGMDETTQAKIFDHLFTTKAVGKGTGLGLAIARQIIVENHGGSLDVQSTVGQGTEFCICLPRLTTLES